MALAWGSIVDDVKEGRLNIDLLQKKQAEKELKTAEDVLPRAARECYKWLLCPVQETPTDPKPTVEAFPLNTTGGSVGGEIERVCIENELVISHLVADPPAHQAQGALLEGRQDRRGRWPSGRTRCATSTCRGFKNRDVLAQAIRSGAASRDFFGTAYGQSGSKFDGFQLGSGNVTSTTRCC